MPRFRILYFRDNVLDRAEEVEVTDVLEAIERASHKPAEVTSEIWSDRGKAGVVACAPDHLVGPPSEDGRTDSTKEAQIAGVMRSRLSVSP